MVVEARLASALLIFLPSVSRQRHKKSLPTRGMLAQAPRDFIAVYVGQSHVDEGDVWHELGGEVESRRPGVGGAHLVSHRVEQKDETFGNLYVVLHHEDA